MAAPRTQRAVWLSESCTEVPDWPVLLPCFGPQTSANAGKFLRSLSTIGAGAATAVLNPTPTVAFTAASGTVDVQAQATDWT